MNGARKGGGGEENDGSGRVGELSCRFGGGVCGTVARGTSPESTFAAGGLIGTFPSTRPEEGVASCRLYDSRLAYCPDSHLGCVMMIL